MTAPSIGDVAAGRAFPRGRRTFQPVRRDSRYAGEREARVWRPIASSKQEARKVIAANMQAAERYERHHKAEGKRNGPLGHIGLEVLRELYRFVDFRSGRLEPAIATICGKIRRSRAAVVAAMARLKAHGFIEWIRRSEPTNNEGAGPQVRQITNAYGFGLPKAAAAWVKRILGKGPAPGCELARRAEDRAMTDAMLEEADPETAAIFYTDDPDLQKSLANLQRSIGRSASSLNGQKPGIEG